MKKVPLFGFQFWNAETEKEIAEKMLNDDKLFAKDHIAFLITPNAFDIAQYHLKYKQLHKKFKGSSIVLADGMPIVWLSKLCGRSLKKRMAGSDVFPVLWKEIMANNKKAYFIMPDENLGKLFSLEYENCHYCHPDIFHPEDNQYISSFISSHLQEIRSFKPDYIFIGLTIPKQQKVALELYEQLHKKEEFKTVIAIMGASYEYYFKLKKRAPRIIQHSGMEWFYRLMQDPVRLWKRYTLGNLQFLYVAARELYNMRQRKNLNGF